MPILIIIAAVVGLFVLGPMLAAIVEVIYAIVALGKLVLFGLAIWLMVSIISRMMNEKNRLS